MADKNMVPLDEAKLRWDAWDGDTLVAMIRPIGNYFNVTMRDRSDEKFLLLTHAIDYVERNV